MKNPAYLALILILLAIQACSGSFNPTTSDNPINPVYLPAGVSDYSTDSSPLGGMGTLGIFNLHVDLSKLSAELSPIRTASLTDVLEVVDITNFLQLAPCTNCAKIRSVELDADGNLVLSIGIKHPFGVGDPLKPISGRNRADLHVFNVEGIVISNSPSILFAGLGAKIADFKMINADGYTGYLDESLDNIFKTEANIHPYILHFDDYSSGNFSPTNPMGFASVTIPPPTGNLVMAMGCDYNYQDYIFATPLEQMNFIYAVGCTYAVSAATKSKRFTPEYRIPQHNKKAASEVRVHIVNNQLRAGDTLSTAQIEIHVVDINHGVPVGDKLNEMLADSSVSSIRIEIPQVLSATHSVDISSPTGSGHSPSDPLIYTTTITNSAGAPNGTYAGLVKVTDSYLPGKNISPLLNGKDGIKRVSPYDNPLTGLFTISEFATYQTFQIEVGSGNNPPVAILKPDPASCQMGESVDFDATASYDTDGYITLYEFDFDWDGIVSHFTPDVINTTGLATSFPYPDDGIYTAGLRVTDNMSAVSYDSVQVTVSPIDVIYVDDSNTSGIEDGSMQYPFNTIQEGVNAASPGKHVWVDDSGNDYDYVLITGKNNITVRSVNWNPSDGGNMASIRRSSGYILTISNSTNCTVDGFKIHGSSDYGLSLSYAPECTIKNCWITNITNPGTGTSVIPVLASYSPGATLKNCEISNCQANFLGGFLIGMMISQSPITIEKCKIHDMFKPIGSGFNMGIYLNNCVPQSGYKTIVRQNKFYDFNMADSGFVIAMYLLQCDDVHIYNNLFYNISKDYAGGNIGIYCNGALNTKITNNTMYDFECDTLNIGIYMNDYYPNSVKSTNNIIQYLHTEEGLPNGQVVYFDTANPTISWDYNNSYQISYPVIPPGVGNISLDSLFIDPANGNFHLQSGSPCIDAGDPSIQDPDNSRSDMGCYGGPYGNW